MEQNKRDNKPFLPSNNCAEKKQMQKKGKSEGIRASPQTVRPVIMPFLTGTEYIIQIIAEIIDSVK